MVTSLVDVNGFGNGPLNTGNAAEAPTATTALTANTAARQSPTILIRVITCSFPSRVGFDRPGSRDKPAFQAALSHLGHCDGPAVLSAPFSTPIRNSPPPPIRIAILYEVMRQVTVYTTDPCSFCARVKGLLASRSVEFAEINLSKDPVGRVELVQRTGMMSFPQVVVDGELIGGFAEVQAAAENGRLDELLAA